MTANPNIHYTHIAAHIGMTDRARLIALFDAVWDSSCDLVVWQLDEPDAPAALEAWATARQLMAVGRRIHPAIQHDVVIDVVGPRRGRISVYVLRGEATSS